MWMLIAIAMVSAALGFQWSRRQRILAARVECLQNGHDWQPEDGETPDCHRLVCWHCGTVPELRFKV